MLRLVGDMLEGGQQQWDETMDNVQVTSSEFRELVRNARQYPAGVLFGKPPPRVENE
jgi:chemotaxis regulatin CheY-phosphate phosphatase CheZ